MVVVVKVPVVGEVPPGRGFVVVTVGAALFVGLVGLGLVFQDLWDKAAVGFGGDKDFGQHQGVRWSTGRLFALVLLDAAQLCSGQGGTRGQW